MTRTCRPARMGRAPQQKNKEKHVCITAKTCPRWGDTIAEGKICTRIVPENQQWPQNDKLCTLVAHNCDFRGTTRICSKISSTADGACPLASTTHACAGWSASMPSRGWQRARRQRGACASPGICTGTPGWAWHIYTHRRMGKVELFTSFTIKHSRHKYAGLNGWETAMCTQ